MADKRTILESKTYNLGNSEFTINYERVVRPFKKAVNQLRYSWKVSDGVCGRIANWYIDSDCGELYCTCSITSESECEEYAQKHFGISFDEARKVIEDKYLEFYKELRCK